MYFEIYQGAPANALAVGARDWRWRLKAANHKIIAQGEGYRNRADCVHAVNLLKQTNALTPIRSLNPGNPFLR